MVFIIILIFIVVIGLIFLLLRLFIKLMKRLYRKGYKTLAILIPLSIALVGGYEIYTALYPPDSFYVEDFERYSGIKYPSSGKILKKTATYPDSHGKYISAALIQFSAADFQKLKNKINSDSLYMRDTTVYPFYGNIMQMLGDQVHHDSPNDFEGVYEIHGLKTFVIGFYKDGQTILWQKEI